MYFTLSSRTTIFRTLLTTGLAISLLSIPAINSQGAPILTLENTIHKIASRIPNFQQQIQHLSLSLANKTGDSQGRSNRVIGSVLKRENIFASLFGRDALAGEEDILELIFENVTQPCEEHFRYALEQVFQSTAIPETWVLQLFDAYGKIPSGILSGHTSEGGDFHECVQIKGDYTSKDSNKKQMIRGRYCSTYVVPGPALLEKLLTPEGQNTFDQLSPGLRGSTSLEELIAYILDFNSIPPMIPMIGTCFPDSCSVEDAQQILSSFHKHISKDLVSQVVIANYVEDKPSFDAGDIAMIIVLVLIGGLCIAGTILDLLSAKTSKPASSQGLSLRMVLTFSFYTNTQKWLSTKAGSDNLGCLHGLRFLSMGWVVLCHTFSMLMMQLTWNTVDAKLMYKDWSFYPILNGTPSVDTFFTLSGTLVAYNLLKELDKRKGKLNYILFVVHRYLRLTPTYVIIMGIMATLLPYTGNGPMWYYIDTESENCGKYWWHNALYVNNLVKYEAGGCYGEAWYLANDMQFFLLSPLVIYPLWRWKRIGLGLISILSIVSVIVPAAITDYKNLPPTFITSIPMLTYMEDVYTKPWTRFGPYVIGIFLGFVLHYRANNLGKFRYIPKWIILIGWTLSTVFALTIIFTGVYYFDPKNIHETFTSFHATAYSGLHRTIWGVVIAWIIFACVSGYGGFVNKILSLKIFMPLGRLTFCMYITSYHIQLIYHTSLPHPEHYSKYSMVNLYFAHMVMSGLVAYFLTMSLESPFIQLEKMLFASQIEQRPVSNPATNDKSADINGNNFDVKIDKHNVNA